MTVHRSVANLRASSVACPHRADSRCEECKVRASSVCAALRSDELAELEAIAHQVSFAAKESLFLESDKARDVFNITSGVVRLYRLFRDGRRQVIGFSFPGDFLGVQLSTDHGFSADAVSDVSVCRFAKRDFEALLARKPLLMEALHGRAATIMRLMQDQVVSLGRRSAEERMAWFITQLRERTALGGAEGSVSIPMSRQDIADYLGLTIETVSRTLSALAKRGVISVEPGGVRVLKEGLIGELAAG